MRWVAALVAGAMLTTPVLAREITPAEQRQYPYDASLPGCDDSSVLGDIVSRFSQDQNAPHRTGIADAERGLSTPFLGGWTIREIGPMALSCVNHRQP